MRLAIFDDWRLGAIERHAETISDITPALPGTHDPDPLGAGWWLRLCRDFHALQPRLAAAASSANARPLADVRLRAPVLNPGKIIACASNYAAHVAEMRDRVLPEQTSGAGSWLLDFDVFLKAPTSISGPADPILLPEPLLAAGREIHHECELSLIIGRGGRDIEEASALDHVLGYLIALDITERGKGDRSRRKSYDTFTPLGPWITTADEIGDPHAMGIELRVGETIRQQVRTAEMIIPIPRIISHISKIMRLAPGDIIMTGAPPGVGPIHPGDILHATITGLGRMSIPVRLARDCRATGEAEPTRDAEITGGEGSAVTKT